MFADYRRGVAHDLVNLLLDEIELFRVIGLIGSC